MAMGRLLLLVEQITLFCRPLAPLDDPTTPAPPAPLVDPPPPPPPLLSGDAAVFEALELEHELDGECRKCPGNCGVIVTFGLEANVRVATFPMAMPMFRPPTTDGDIGGDIYEGTR